MERTDVVTAVVICAQHVASCRVCSDLNPYAPMCPVGQRLMQVYVEAWGLYLIGRYGGHRDDA